ncbi:hypothetical protein ABBQ32_005987 [Trebouxia sp. C0010 RCD-2024]
MVMNAALQQHPAARLKCIKDSIPRNSSEDDFLGCLPDCIDAFVPRWNQGGLAHEDTGYAHAVCIRRHPATDKWYLLDSENQRAKQMTPQLWKDLKGSMFALAEGSAYNHNVIVGARDEGYTQVEEDLTLILPNDVTLTHNSGARARPMTRKRRQTDSKTPSMVVKDGAQRPPKQTIQSIMESALQKQVAKPPAAQEEAAPLIVDDMPVAATLAHKALSSSRSSEKTNAMKPVQHKRSDIRSFMSNKPCNGTPTAVTAGAPDDMQQQA